MSQAPPDFSGFLDKESASGLFRTRHARWFELRGSTVSYYKSKPLNSDQAVTLGIIDVRNGRIEEDPAEPLALNISGPHLQRPYKLFASSDAEKNEWIRRLQLAAVPPAYAGGGGAAASGVSTAIEAAAAAPDAPEGFGAITLADFDVMCELGDGSFGKVLLVKKRDSGELYAMKQIGKEGVDRHNVLDQIFLEQSILQSIRHPFVVGLHYAFQTKDMLCLVLTYLAGGELYNHLSASGQFDEPRAKFYCAEIGLAVGHLHRMNIIYRDLKPENAVLDRDGHVCLTDFGLAKADVSAPRGAKTFCGTPEYLAPELLMGEGHGKAVDWWSLGVLLYEMLAGQLPFYSDNLHDLYKQILVQPIEYDPAIFSPVARDLLTRLLDRSPDTRLQSVEEFQAHPFFADINWSDLEAKRVPPPFRPDVLSPTERNKSPRRSGRSSGSGSQRGSIASRLAKDAASGWI